MSIPILASTLYITVLTPLRRAIRTAQTAQINAEFPTFASDLFKRAMAAGYGDEEAAALVKVLRDSTRS